MKKIRAVKKPAEKIDPAFLAKARELRDRWLECVNAGDAALPAPRPRYQIGRSAAARATVKSLPAAAFGGRRQVA